jgi:hypothetical protein
MSDKDMTSRFCVCCVGNGFSVEDRRTGERVSYHATWGRAESACKKYRAAYRHAVASSLDDEGSLDYFNRYIAGDR